ncbi:MAG: hypothetical protein D6816_12305 [Bacteroidetes bacterium]|nr:MAG: hypothetical protein D6816_12305 [Bacteroidota bacterium]
MAHDPHQNQARDTSRDIYVRTEIGTGAKLFFGSALFILFFLIVSLNLPLETLNAPQWLIELQTNLLNLSKALAPYLIVGVLGSIVGIAELTSAFQTYPREAMRTRWAKILIGVNSSTAILALGITRLTMPTMNSTLQVILVGLGFQSLIRTKFVLAKQIGSKDGSGEISVNIGWLYDQFQNLCRTQIDLELMNNRRTAVTDLLLHYPSLTELYDIAYYTIIARATLSPSEEEERLSRLEKLIDPSAPENFAKTSIALLILENGGPGYVNLLMDQAHQTSPEGAATAVFTTEQLVTRMVNEFSLERLVELAEKMTAAEDVLEWIREAAKPNPGTSESNQKAAICHMIIQQTGVEAVQKAITQEKI